MQRMTMAAAVMLSGLMAAPALAQTETNGGTMAPGNDAPPSVESNRNATPHSHTRTPRHHANKGPGKAASPSLKDNQGDTGMPSASSAPAGNGANAGAGGPASVSNNANPGAPK